MATTTRREIYFPLGHPMRVLSQNQNQDKRSLKVDRFCMPMPGGPKSLQITHEYSHKRIQNKQIRDLGRKTHAHMPCTYRHRHTQNTRIHTRAYTYTVTSGSTETQKTSRDVDSPLDMQTQVVWSGPRWRDALESDC